MELARPLVRGIRVRLLGVAARNLAEPSQLALFAEAEEEERRRRTVEAVDAIRRRFGSRAVTRARLLDAAVPEPFERDPRGAPDRVDRRA